MRLEVIFKRILITDFEHSNNCVQRYDYGPFGETLSAQGARTNSLQYTGEQHDGDTGLIYLRARWYDPSTGRFTARDPFPGLADLPQTQHPYAYVGNNPINLTDPSGKIAPLLIAAAVAYVAGLFAYDYLDAQTQSGLGRALLDIGGLLSGYESIQQDWQKVVDPCTSVGCKILAAGDAALNGAPGMATSLAQGQMPEIAGELSRTPS